MFNLTLSKFATEFFRFLLQRTARRDFNEVFKSIRLWCTFNLHKSFIIEVSFLFLTT